MKLIGRERLAHLRVMGEPAEKWIQSWVAEVTTAHWKSPIDVRSQFPNVRQADDGHILFPVNDFGIVIQVRMAFPQGIALITALINSEENHGH